jgi:outer membrane protein assembly factor BamA
MIIIKSPLSLPASAAAVIILFFLNACSVIPRNYPANRPFVYETNINLEGNFSKEERSNLISELKNQLDDSLKTRTVYKLFYKGFNRSVLQRPPVYDSNNAEQSVKFMRALLNAKGYFRDTITYDTSMVIKADAKPPQYRTIIHFRVNPGKLVTLDSVYFQINHSELQSLAVASAGNMLVKKGDPFSIQGISREFDRLVELYRDHGYLRFTREELVGIWDTLNVSLLQPTFDPFEQILLFEALRKKRENPTANLEIRLRPGYDVSRLKKYYVGHTTVYPDLRADTLGRKQMRFEYDSNLSIVSYRRLFKPHFIASNIFFKQGDLYNQKMFLKTINRFNSLGAWRLVTIEQMPRSQTDTVDFAIHLTPADKYSFTANLEGSSNSSFFLEERLLGIGINAQLLNRNFGHSSNQATSSIRYGTEVDTKGEFVKTRQASFSHSIFFPKPIPNVTWLPEQFRDNFRTVLSFSLGNIERKDLFNLTSLNASWGYNFVWKNKKDNLLSANLKIPNIEYAFLNPRPKLDSIFIQTPSFRNIFNTGLVVSVQAGFQIRGGKGRAANLFRANLEESGLVSNLIHIKALDSLFRFIKLNAEFIRNITLGKNSFVFRTFTGAGFALATRTRKTNVNLPFFKQFYAGGPNSMRAWGLRTLGPGSTVKTRDEVPFRFGDFQFETNAEFRFPLTRISGYQVSSCAFVDIGNVWFLKKNTDFPDGSLTAEKFLKDLAVGIGTGLRFDFEFFRVRLDYAVKVKNPTPEPVNMAGRNKWFYHFSPLGGIVQLGINYPFAF